MNSAGQALLDRAEVVAGPGHEPAQGLVGATDAAEDPPEVVAQAVARLCQRGDGAGGAAVDRRKQGGR